MLSEVRSITYKNIVIQMDNARVHLLINSLKLNKETK